MSGSKFTRWATTPAAAIGGWLVTLALVVTTVVLFMQGADVRSRQAATEAAQQVVIQGRCDQLRTSLDPKAPPPSTAYGEYVIARYRVEASRLHCDQVPPLSP